MIVSASRGHLFVLGEEAAPGLARRVDMPELELPLSEQGDGNTSRTP
ncbi:hypothetical protein [Streptomyces kanamyceticus]|nr:hypothetical protein [Streptomyces kanamyceticus]